MLLFIDVLLKAPQTFNHFLFFMLLSIMFLSLQLCQTCQMLLDPAYLQVLQESFIVKYLHLLLLLTQFLGTLIILSLKILHSSIIFLNSNQILNQFAGYFNDPYSYSFLVALENGLIAIWMVVPNLKNFSVGLCSFTLLEVRLKLSHSHMD